MLKLAGYLLPNNSALSQSAMPCCSVAVDHNHGIRCGLSAVVDFCSSFGVIVNPGAFWCDLTPDVRLGQLTQKSVSLFYRFFHRCLLVVLAMYGQMNSVIMAATHKRVFCDNSSHGLSPSKALWPVIDPLDALSRSNRRKVNNRPQSAITRLRVNKNRLLLDTSIITDFNLFVNRVKP